MKTREEQIQEQAELCFGSNKEYAIVFAQGARWADHNPKEQDKKQEQIKALQEKSNIDWATAVMC